MHRLACTVKRLIWSLNTCYSCDSYALSIHMYCCFTWMALMLYEICYICHWGKTTILDCNDPHIHRLAVYKNIFISLVIVRVSAPIRFSWRQAVDRWTGVPLLSVYYTKLSIVKKRIHQEITANKKLIYETNIYLANQYLFEFIVYVSVYFSNVPLDSLKNVLNVSLQQWYPYICKAFIIFIPQSESSKYPSSYQRTLYAEKVPSTLISYCIYLSLIYFVCTRARLLIICCWFSLNLSRLFQFLKKERKNCGCIQLNMVNGRWNEPNHCLVHSYLWTNCIFIWCIVRDLDVQ